MKRIIAVLLVLTTVFTVSGCKDKSHNVSEDDISSDIKQFVSMGKIKEADFALGTTPSEIESAELDFTHEDGGDGGHEHEHGIEKEEGMVSFHYTYGPFQYYYNKGKEDKGISFIVSFDKAYDFSVGYTAKFEVENALKNINFTKRKAESKDLFFLVVEVEDCDMLIYNFEKYELSFYFKDDILICTTLQNTENWSLNG